METLTLVHRGAVAIVRLNRPPVNAINREMMAELRQCFDTLAEDRTVNAVVLSATGAKAFCAGIDLRDLPGPRGPDGTIADTLDGGRFWRDTQYAVRHCPVPVIAAVGGAAIGAGFGLIGVCDLIVAARGATFALTEINVGVLGGASKALRMVGPFKARMMLFSGEPLTAEELYRFGAVETITEDGQAEDRALKIADQFATKSPIALRLAKESILRIEGSVLEDSYRTEQDYTHRLRSYDDSREAMLAFRERRDPRWSWS
jgi:enoyl-CoA hydratase